MTFATAILPSENKRDKRRDPLVALNRMAKRKMIPDLVPVSATVANPFDVPRLLEIGDNPLHGTLRNPDQVSGISHPHFGLLR